MSTFGSTVYVTQYPQKCVSGQNSTSVAAPGAAVVFSQTGRRISINTLNFSSENMTSAKDFQNQDFFVQVVLHDKQFGS